MNRKRKMFGFLAILLSGMSGFGMTQQAVKLARIDPGIYAQYAGNYQLASDRVISIGPFSAAGNLPLFFDSRTRRVGVLYPVSETRFVTGALRDNESLTPADLRLEFIRSQTGAVTGIIWREGKAPQLRGFRVSPHRNEEVVFQNGEITLRGTLTLPTTAGPHPVVIFLQEAGPRSRPFGMWPYLFVRYGIAMLTFDKRGSGASNGDWQFRRLGR